MRGDGTATPREAIHPTSGLEHDAIRPQLDRILASPEFHATDKMRGFLRFVVEEKLAGRSHRIKGYTVAVRHRRRDEHHFGIKLLGKTHTSPHSSDRP